MDDSRLEEAILAAREAANEAFAAAAIDDDVDGTGERPQIRLMLCATTGDPSAAYAQSEVRFAAPPDVAISHSDKVAMSLASMKAVAPDLYATMVAGLERGRRLSLGALLAKMRSAAG